MTNHIASVHEKRKLFKCSICDYKCSLKGNLTRHIKSVHEDNNNSSVSFVITDVQWRGNWLSTFHQSIRETNHSSVPSVITMFTKGKLDYTHYISSLGKKPFKCSICDYDCSRKEILASYYNSSWGQITIQVFHLWLQVFKKANFHSPHCISSWGQEIIQVLHLWFQLFRKGKVDKTHCISSWGQKTFWTVQFVITNVHKRWIWQATFHQFMSERSHSSVPFVITTV